MERHPDIIRGKGEIYAEYAAKQQGIQEARQMAQAAKAKLKEMKRDAITQKMEAIFSEAQRKRDAIDSTNRAEVEERADKDSLLRQLKREEMWEAIDRWSLLSRYTEKLPRILALMSNFSVPAVSGLAASCKT